MNDSTSLAIVAQQVLDMGQSAVTEIVAVVKGIAPEVWEMLMRQIYIEAAYYFTAPLLVLGVCWMVFRPLYARAQTANWEYPGSAIGSVLAGIGMVIAAITWITQIGPVVGRLLNPELYAIQKFLHIASGGGL